MSTNLRTVREQEGLSRAALARAAGVSEKTLQRLELGKNASTVTKAKVVKALNRLPDRLQTYTSAGLFDLAEGQ
jgi:transcriptional regulator with XRE-family HTH domain